MSINDIRTKEFFVGVTIYGVNQIRTEELKHAIQDLVEGWSKRHDYEAICFDCTINDITKKMNQNYLSDIAKQDQEEATKPAS